MFQIMGEFSSSEDELENLENRPGPCPMRLDFINLYRLGLCDCLALSSLPGCRCKASFTDRQRFGAQYTCMLAGFETCSET